MRCLCDLLKFVLFILNFLAFVVIGLALAFTIYVLLEPESVLKVNVELNLSQDNPTALYFSLILICLVVLGFLFIFTFLGCCGAACQNRCMLGSFSIMLFVLLAANGAAIAYIFYCYPHVKGEVDMLVAQLKKTILYYKGEDPDSISKKFWDWIQPQMRCCGIKSYKDWSLAELKPGHEVPSSCCYAETPNCVTDAIDGAYDVGCLVRVEFAWRVIFWALPSIMAVIFLFSLVVCSRSDARNDDDRVDPYRKSGRRGRADYSNNPHSEDTDYVYRSSTPNYGRSPPYNPDYHHQPQSAIAASGYGHMESMDRYPTGVIPPNQEYLQPLVQQHPPSYHEVVSRSNR